MNIEDLSKCLLTGLDAKDLHLGREITYTIALAGKNHQITLCRACTEKKLLQNAPFRYTGHIIKGLIANEKLKFNDVVHWDSEEKSGMDLRRILLEGSYPRSPKEKLENLFKELYQLQDFDGAGIAISRHADNAYRFYFKNFDELDVYIQALVSAGIIENEGTSKSAYQLNLTYNGLNEYVNLFEEGYNSTKCFVAMAFQDNTVDIRSAIKSALIKTGFEPILVDEQNISSDQTINDYIIAGLKQSKFCIADFTYHKNGVYFESGFALGQGKNVIYTCREDEFKHAHFDIRPLQHIIYKTPAELEKMLIAKIEAWIK